MRKLSDLDRGWLAGILEGEGTFCTVRSSARADGSRLHSPRIRVTQCDRTIIARLVAITGVGRVGGPWEDKRADTLSRQPEYAWDVNHRPAVRAITEAVWDQLSLRRQEQITAMYERWEASCLR